MADHSRNNRDVRSHGGLGQPLLAPESYWKNLDEWAEVKVTVHEDCQSDWPCCCDRCEGSAEVDLQSETWVMWLCKDCARKAAGDKQDIQAAMEISSL